MTNHAPRPVDGSPPPLLGATTLLRQAIQERRLTKEFLAATEFSEIGRALLQPHELLEPKDFWFAIATLGRAANVSKPAEANVKPIILHLLSGKIPTYVTLPDGEDRYYLAKALEYHTDPVITQIAFSELAGEELAETARAVWVGIAIQNSPTKAGFLHELNNQLEKLPQAGPLSSDSLARRVKRISALMLDPLITSDLVSGRSYGSELRRFFAGQFRGRPPTDKELRDEFALDMVAGVSRVVRLNFSAGSDPAVYMVAADVRTWWRPASLPLKLEQAIIKLARTGVEALHIFARQGVKNVPLREAIVQAAGADMANTIAKRIVSDDSSLSEDISNWMVSGREIELRRSTQAIDELVGNRLDEYIGRLLIVCNRPDANSSSVALVAERIADFMPDEAAVVSSASKGLAQTYQWARAIARSRSIELIGSIGEVVPYDPALHIGNSAIVLGSDVRVVTPGIVKADNNRPSQLIQKIEVSQ